MRKVCWIWSFVSVQFPVCQAHTFIVHLGYAESIYIPFISTNISGPSPIRGHAPILIWIHYSGGNRFNPFGPSAYNSLYVWSSAIHVFLMNTAWPRSTIVSFIVSWISTECFKLVIGVVRFIFFFFSGFNGTKDQCDEVYSGVKGLTVGVARGDLVLDKIKLLSR